MGQKRVTIIDPELNLHQLPIFIITAFTGITLAIIITAQVWPLSPQTMTDYTSLNEVVFKILKVPTAIIAVTLSLLVIIGTIHRSAQTSKQIEITLKQNSFSNYYSHLDTFEQYLLKHNKLFYQEKIHSIKNLHDILWPNLLKNDYHISNTLINETDELFKILHKVIYMPIETNNDIESKLEQYKYYTITLFSKYGLEVPRSVNEYKKNIGLNISLSDEMVFGKYVNIIADSSRMANDITYLLRFEADDYSKSFSKEFNLIKDYNDFLQFNKMNGEAALSKYFN